MSAFVAQKYSNPDNVYIQTYNTYGTLFAGKVVEDVTVSQWCRNFKRFSST